MSPIAKNLIECIDLEKASNIIIDEVALAALKKVVEDSENKFDDAAYAMLVPLLVPEMKKILLKKIEELKA